MGPLLRHHYPGVAPWEWDAHPDWQTRVLAGLNAEYEAVQAIEETKGTPQT